MATKHQRMWSLRTWIQGPCVRYTSQFTFQVVVDCNVFRSSGELRRLSHAGTLNSRWWWTATSSACSDLELRNQSGEFITIFHGYKTSTNVKLGNTVGMLSTKTVGTLYQCIKCAPCFIYTLITIWLSWSKYVEFVFDNCNNEEEYWCQEIGGGKRSFESACYCYVLSIGSSLGARDHEMILGKWK